MVGECVRSMGEVVKIRRDRGEKMNGDEIKVVAIDTTEEGVLNPDALPAELRGWRYYRIEYGGCNEECLWEGRVLLPPRADPTALVQLILGMQAHEQLWEEVK